MSRCYFFLLGRSELCNHIETSSKNKVSPSSYFSFFPRSLFLIIVFFGTIAACSKTPELAKISGFAQGTTYNLTFEKPHSADLKTIEAAVEKELTQIDAALSNYRDDSDIEKFNQQKTDTPFEVNAALVELIQITRDVNRASNGCYDPTIKPLFDLWGFKKDKFSPPSDDTLALTLASVGLDNLETVDNTHLRKQIPALEVDISSIGQGYSVGQLVKVLQGFGVVNYLVEIGGELQINGKKPNGEAWRIALEKPLPNERKLQKIVSFNSGAVMALMTSGTYRHYFDDKGKRYSHIIDARTGKPVEHNTVSVTVLHPNPSVADAWSTALLCLGDKEGLKIANHYNIAALFITQVITQDKDQFVESQTLSLDKMNDVSFTQP